MNDNKNAPNTKLNESNLPIKKRTPTVTFKLQDVIESTVKKQLEKNNQPHSSKDTSKDHINR